MKTKKVFEVVGEEEIQFITKKDSLNKEELVVLKGGRGSTLQGVECDVKSASDNLS